MIESNIVSGTCITFFSLLNFFHDICVVNIFINKWAAKLVKQFYVRIGDAGVKSSSVLFKSMYNKFHTRIGDIECGLENGVI